MFVEPLAIKKALLQIWQSLEDRQFFQGNVFTNGGLTSIDNKSSYPHGVVPTPQNPWNLVINTYDHTSSSTTQPKKIRCIPHSIFWLLQPLRLFLPNSTTTENPKFPTVGRPAVPRIISNHGHWKSSSCMGLWDPEVKAMVSPSGSWSSRQGVIVSEISHLAQNMDGFGFKSSKRCDICEPFWHVYLNIYIYFVFFYMFFKFQGLS